MAVACLAAVVLFQGWVTFRVWRSEIYERQEKVNQTRLIWLLPALGAAIAFSVLQQEETAVQRVESHIKKS